MGDVADYQVEQALAEEHWDPQNDSDDIGSAFAAGIKEHFGKMGQGPIGNWSQQFTAGFGQTQPGAQQAVQNISDQLNRDFWEDRYPDPKPKPSPKSVTLVYECPNCKHRKEFSAEPKEDFLVQCYNCTGRHKTVLVGKLRPTRQSKPKATKAEEFPVFPNNPLGSWATSPQGFSAQPQKPITMADINKAMDAMKLQVVNPNQNVMVVPPSMKSILENLQAMGVKEQDVSKYVGEEFRRWESGGKGGVK